MPDSKITALASTGTGTDPANDPLVIVDVSDTSMAATGTTKKVTLNNLLACSPTATLASATITGDLTVATSSLKVTGGNASIGTATPNTNSNRTTLTINNATWGGQLDINVGATNHASFGTDNFDSGASCRLQSKDSIVLKTAGTGANSYLQLISSTGVTTWYDGAGGTRMTLNATGLGVGGPPAGGVLMTVGATSSVSATANAVSIYSNKAALVITCDGATNAAGTLISYSWANGGQGPLIFRNAAISNVMTLDATGQVGIGVTPSAKLDVVVPGAGSPRFRVNNVGDDPVAEWQRFTGSASNFYGYRIVGGFGNFEFQNSNQAAIGSQTFTTRMTLDASGRLLVGKAASNFATVGSEIKANGSFTSTQSDSTNGSTAWDTYSTGASAYRFYVGMAGTVFATNTTISAISDARFKENIQDLDVGLGAILALKPRKFDWKAGKGKDIKGDRGFIAQEFEQVFPNLVDEWRDNAPEGEAPYKSVRQDLIPVLVKAIQELAAEVNALKNA
jgi:hypothetical protein